MNGRSIGSRIGATRERARRCRPQAGPRVQLAGPILALLSAWLLTAQAEADQQPQRFATSDRCLACHNGLFSHAGEEVSIGTDWSSSVMANAARDPYWQAAVRRESLDHPQARGLIEDECTRCHMPMATAQADLSQQKGQAFRYFAFPPPQSDQDRLAMDGVSCSICHQITAARLGDPSTFTGHFVLDTATPWGRRKEFGPFSTDAARLSVMQSAARFVPTQAKHIRDAAFCATCHTLYTDALGPKGEVIGHLPEQVPYLEWLHSSYSGRQSCQACHMPPIQDGTAFTSVLPERRVGWGRHNFRGGNFLLERIMGLYGPALQAVTEPPSFEIGLRQTLDFLWQRSARLSLQARLQAGTLTAGVVVTNLTGHKLPTAYPARRAWIHFKVLDQDGRLVFESGRLEPSGLVVGNDNDRDPLRYEPHYDRIEHSDQVQIYESIMGDARDHATTGLLSGVRYLKDNRLLPAGFDPATAVADIAVRGEARQDASFKGGQDQVDYVISVGSSRPPFRVQAELWFQPVGYRWAHNLEPYPAREPRRFVAYYRSLSPVSATVLAQVETQAK